MDFPLQNKVVGSGKLPGYRIRKWGLVEESHHGMRNRRMKRKVRDIMYGRSYTLCLFFCQRMQEKPPVADPLYLYGQ